MVPGPSKGTLGPGCEICSRCSCWSDCRAAVSSRSASHVALAMRPACHAGSEADMRRRADGTCLLTRSQRHERREGDRGFSTDASSGMEQVLTWGLRAIWGPSAVGPTCAAAATGAAAAAHVGPTFLLLQLRFNSAVANVCGRAFGANANHSVDVGVDML